MDKIHGPVIPATSPVEHLLVATNFTERSSCAIDRAVECGGTLGAQVTVLHVIEPGLPGKIAKRRHCAAREVLANHVHVLSSDFPRDISINVRVGDPHLEIIREAIELGSDTIILGFTGRDAFSDAPVASTATGVVRYFNKPVLLVARRPAGPYRRSVVDVSVASQRTASAACRIAPAAEPHFVLVRSQSTAAHGESKEDPLWLRCEQLRRSVYGRNTPSGDPVPLPVTSDDPINALLGRVAHIRADLLVVSSEAMLQETCGRLGDLLQALYAAPQCDLLLVPGQ